MEKITIGRNLRMFHNKYTESRGLTRIYMIVYNAELEM